METKMDFKYDEKYKFTEQWFDHMIPLWDQVFSQYKTEYDKDIESVLEIGCYEGRATVWLCENILNDSSKTYHYDIVDTFGGSEIESGMARTLDNLSNDTDAIETAFRHNISFFDNIKFNIHKGISQNILPTFEPIEKYDFIYIDASHKADDTFVDAYYAHKMLKKGGILIFDDYGWKDPTDMHASNSPQLAIDVFKLMYEREYHVVYTGYQVVFNKLI
jgi:hypothetical protein